MDYIEIIEILEKQYLSNLSRKRAEHCRRTAVTAGELALQFGIDRDKAYMAGLSHDIARELSYSEIMKWAEKYKPYQILKDERELPLLLHGRAAAAILQEEQGFHDEEILDSLTWHISGNEIMSGLDKVIYCADFLEPGREFLNNDFRKKALSSDLDHCVLHVLTSILEHRGITGHKPSKRELDLLNSLSGEKGGQNA